MGALKKRGGVWWIRYYRNGRRLEESAKTGKKSEAQRLLKVREGDIAKGVPLTAAVSRLRFDDAAADVMADYRVNGKRAIEDVEARFRLHLLPFFGGRRMASITAADIRAYVAQRQAATVSLRRAHTVRRQDGTVRVVAAQRRSIDGVSNAQINRELALLKRAFNLAIQGGTLLTKPHIPMLRESNPRSGFFERDQFHAVLPHLPDAVRGVVEFAYITGWRVPSEVLTLRWRQVDWAGAEVRLDPGTTKNREGRVFPFTTALRTLLERQLTASRALEARGIRCPYVFHRNGRPIKSFIWAWRNACRLAGCPGRLVHDLRRTAVRNLVRAGVAERVAMRLSGHLTRSVFERYNIVSEGDLREAAVKIEAATGTIPGTVEPAPRYRDRRKSLSGGEEGIRTLGRGLRPYNGLANRRLQPLGHLTARGARPGPPVGISGNVKDTSGRQGHHRIFTPWLHASASHPPPLVSCTSAAPGRHSLIGSSPGARAVPSCCASTTPTPSGRRQT